MLLAVAIRKAIAAAFATWARASASGSIDSSGEVFSGTSTSAYGMVLASMSLSGKTYFEVDLDLSGETFITGFGAQANDGTTAPIDNFIGYNTTGVGGFPRTGYGWYVYFNAAATSGSPYSAGSSVDPSYRGGVAVDPATRKVWLRLVWSNGATAWAGGGDPATGTTPTATIGGTDPIYPAACSKAPASGACTATLLPNPSAYYGAAPSGFTAGLSSAPLPFALTGTLTATAQVGVPYSSTLTLSGTYIGTVTMGTSAGSLPSWMSVSVSGNTVTYSGTPDSTTAVSFTPTATDSSSPTPKVATGSAQSITVDAAPAMTLSGALPSTATVGTAYTGTMTLGGSYTTPVTITGLAAWMSYSISGSTVTITGTPTAAETDTLTIVATDSSTPTAQTASSAQTVTVSAGSTSYAVLSGSGYGHALSNGGLTLNCTDGGGGCYIASASCKEASTANIYWEVHCDAVTANTSNMVGIAVAGYGNKIPGYTYDGATAQSYGISPNGKLYGNQSVVKTLTAFATGATLKFLLKNGKLYIGMAGGAWFNSGDPAAETGYVVSGLSGSWGAGAGSNGASTYQWTFNFGASSWTGAPPSGATGWTA